MSESMLDHPARGIADSRASHQRTLLCAEDWVWLAGGAFLMGSPDGEIGRLADERRHRVRVAGFGLMRTPVTWGMYRRFCTANQRPFDWYPQPPRPEFDYDEHHPVVNVSWNDAIAYAEWLSAETGWRCRLPTEAEWEYACRAGAETAYAWGRELGHDRANCTGFGSHCDAPGTAPVKSFAPNAWGLYEMHGNQWEWTSSGYDEANQAEDDREIRPASQAAPRLMIVRGGSWADPPSSLRAAFRSAVVSTSRLPMLGFRLALDEV